MDRAADREPFHHQGTLTMSEQVDDQPDGHEAGDMHDVAPVPIAIRTARAGESSDGEPAAAAQREPPGLDDPVFEVSDLHIWYGNHHAVRNVTMDIGSRQITAMIGPSGCGKSTVLRCFNRMNDLIPDARVVAKVSHGGEQIY